MKTIEIFFLRALVVILVFGSFTDGMAQTDRNEDENFTTVFGEQPKIGVAFRLSSQLTKIDRDPGVMLSPSVGLLINRKFFLGAEFSTLLDPFHIRDASYAPVSDETAYWHIAHGGLRVNYLFRLPRGVDIGLGTLIGGGRVERKFICNSLSEKSPEYDDFDQRLKNDGRYFVAEPSAILGVRLARALKFELSAGYRFMSGVRNWDTVGMTDSKFSGPGVGLTMQILVYER